MNAQEVLDKLEPRLREMETFKAWIYGALAVGGIFAALGTWSLSQTAELTRTVAGYGSKFTASESQLGKLEVQLAKVEADLREQEKAWAKKHDELRAANDQLRRNVIVLWDRQPKGPPGLIETLVHHGQVLSISPQQITILPPELGEPAYQFPLPKDVPVYLKRRVATLPDVKVGMSINVVVVGGKITLLNDE